MSQKHRVQQYLRVSKYSTCFCTIYKVNTS